MNALDKRLMLLKSSGMPELVNDLMYIFPHRTDDNGDGSVSRAEDFGDE